jgi:GNAT superfamily N-acetyltransferase
VTKEQVQEVLEALKTPFEDRTTEGLPPNDNGNNPFMDSECFNSIFKTIEVVDEDYGSGNFSFCLFVVKDAHKIAEMAAKMYDHLPEDERKGQFEADFFQLPNVENKAWQVGHVGVSDFLHRYWPMVYVVSKSENKEFATKLMEKAIQILQDAGANPRVGLVDGGKALIEALKDLAQEIRSCHAHVVRLPGSRGGGKRGSKGSLPRYLLNTVGMKLKEMSKVSTKYFYARQTCTYLFTHQ